MVPTQSCALVLIGILLTGTSPSVQSQVPTSWPFATIAVGDRSGISTPTQVVARTLPEFADLWRRHTTGLPGPLRLPRVDFSREMVIGVFAGVVTVPSRIAIVKISPGHDRIIVLVHMASLYPGPLGAEPGGGTPFHIVRVPRSPLSVVFVPAKLPDPYRPP